MLEAPALERIQTEYQEKGVEVVAINVLPQFTLENWKTYLESMGLEHAIIAQDTTHEAVRALQVSTSGTTIILNRKGVEVYRDGSASSFEQLKLAITKGL